jgi:hypothetical protein
MVEELRIRRRTCTFIGGNGSWVDTVGKYVGRRFR